MKRINIFICLLLLAAFITSGSACSLSRISAQSANRQPQTASAGRTPESTPAPASKCRSVLAGMLLKTIRNRRNHKQSKKNKSKRGMQVEFIVRLASLFWLPTI
jgi:hypothetical protein